MRRDRNVRVVVAGGGRGHASPLSGSTRWKACRCGNLGTIALVLFLGLMAGCIPATVPAQLSHTPGPPVSVTDDVYISADFRVMRPAGWRVITSAADAPPSVIFVSPDDSALILVTAGDLGEPPQPQAEPPFREATETVARDGETVTLYAVAPAADWATVERTFERVLASVAPPPTA